MSCAAVWQRLVDHILLTLYCAIFNNEWHVSRLLTPDRHTPCASSPIAVAATLIQDHHHAAILFIDRAGEVRRLHFIGRNPSCESLAASGDEDSFVWAERRLPPIQERQLAYWCEWIDAEQANIDIQYRFGYSPDSHLSGIYFIDANSRGLTCSSFVNLVFRQSGAEFLDADNWKVTNDDILVREKFMRDHKIVPGSRHYSTFNSEINMPRISPADVVAGYMFETVPVGFTLVRRTKAILESAATKYYNRSGVA